MPDKKTGQSISSLQTFYTSSYTFHIHPQPKGINAVRKIEQVRELYIDGRKTMYKEIGL